LAKKLGVPPSNRKEFKEQLWKDANYAIENVFAGKYSYPAHGEYFLLFNAFQMSGAEDSDTEVEPRFESVWEIINALTNMLSVVGITDRIYHLEDIANIIH
jgi:hypothetical protein